MKNYKLFFLISIISFFQSMGTVESKEFGDPKIIPVKTVRPEEKKIYPIAIIGAGAAGSMAVKRAVLNNNEILLFTGAKQEQRRSRGNWVRKIDNIPGLSKYSRTILELRNEVLQELVQSPLGHNLYIIEESVATIKTDATHFTLTDGAGYTYYAKYVVMATGIMDEQPHIQGSIRPVLKYANGQTIVYCSLCDGHQSFGKKSVVIGHADAAAKIALLLSEKYQPTSITLLTNGKKNEFTQKSLERLQNRKITIIEAPINEILGDKKRKQLSGFVLNNRAVIEADIAFVALGIRPNNKLALQLGAHVDADGLVITDPNGESSVPNMFVIGDLRANSMKQIYTAWQQATESVQIINQRIRETNSNDRSSL